MNRAVGVEYEAKGEGDAILMIHGAIFADSFAAMMDEPALGRYRRIRYRRRGYGDSDAPPDPPTIEAQAADALALLEHLGAGPAHVVGHSGGGPPAVQLAISAPEMVRSVVLLEPALQDAATAAAFDEMIAPLGAMYRAGDRGKAVHLWVKSSSGSNWRSEVEAVRPGVTEAAEVDAGATFGYDLPALRTWDFTAVASHVPQPLLFVVGGRSSGPRFDAIWRMVQSAQPAAERVVVPDADHSLRMTKPREVAEVIAAFLP